jgi:hypothetical protein
MVKRYQNRNLAMGDWGREIVLMENPFKSSDFLSKMLKR